MRGGGSTNPVAQLTRLSPNTSLTVVSNSTLLRDSIKLPNWEGCFRHTLFATLLVTRRANTIRIERSPLLAVCSPLAIPKKMN